MDPDLSTIVLRQIIFDLLPKGNPSIVMVSSRLGIPIRTLQRRLKNDGLTYSRLVADVRCEAACRLLKDPSSGVAGIATALGYADPSNFSRAFQRWTGISPRQYQQQIEITPSNVTKN